MFKMTKEESIDGSNTEKIIHKFSDVDEKSTVFKINAAFLVFSLIYSFGQLIKLILDLFFDVEMGDSLLVRIIKLIFDTTPLFLIIVIGIGLGTTVFEMIEPGSISKLFEISRHDVIEKLKKIFQKRDGQNKPRKDQMDQKPVNVKKLIVKRVRLAIMLVLLVVLFYMIVLRPFDEESELKYQTYISLIELLELILFVSLVYSSTKEDASVLNVVKYIFVMVLVSVVISLMQYYGFAYFLDVSLVFSLIRADEGTIMNFIGVQSDPFLPVFGFVFLLYGFRKDLKDSVEKIIQNVRKKKTMYTSPRSLILTNKRIIFEKSDSELFALESTDYYLADVVSLSIESPKILDMSTVVQFISRVLLLCSSIVCLSLCLWGFFVLLSSLEALYVEMGQNVLMHVMYFVQQSILVLIIVGLFVSAKFFILFLKELVNYLKSFKVYELKVDHKFQPCTTFTIPASSRDYSMFFKAIQAFKTNKNNGGIVSVDY